ncbi:MAG: hypothetical protein QM541_01485 [Flavobacterium sp.]|nr:hypothetical protein [Flavobacterium sp.]
MAVQVPPTGVMQKNQLWNLVLVSTSNNPIIVRIKITLLSTNDNSPVMSAVSRTFSLTKGAKQIGSNDVMPIQYNYLSAIFNVDRNPNGFLPIGNYLACYTVTKIIGDAVSELSEECLPVEVAPLSPPLLNTPFDKDTLTTSYPIFTWLPPAPLNLFSDLSYDMSLVEVQPGQAATQAIQQNIPIYTTNRLTTPTNAYPASNKALDTSKLYAWRIAANNNGQLVAQSDVWTFRLKNHDTELNKISSNNTYALLRDDYTGTYSVSNRLLYVKYESLNNTSSHKLQFTDAENNSNIQQEERMINQGENYLTFKLSNTFKEGKTYVLTILDSNNKQHFLRFSLIKN